VIHHIKTVTPRGYQQLAIDAIIKEVTTKPKGNAIAVLATGAGKSLVIAEVARLLDTHILILQPSREILEQNVEKMLGYVGKDEIGIYSASAGEKTIAKYTFAMIGSIYTKPQDFAHFGLVIIDECHGVNPNDTGSMFQQFLQAIGSPKCIGLTATPWRQSTVWIDWGTINEQQVTTTKVLTRMKGKRESMFWNRIIINIDPEYLMQEGYLCRPEYYNNSRIKHSEIPMNKSRSEFDLEAYEKLIQKDEERILDAVVRAGTISHSVLVFTTSVEQAHRFASVVKGSAVVSAKTPAKERKKIIEDFKSGVIKTVFNMNCLAVGFDHPALDAIVVTMPTNSITRWVQICGRGMRNSPGKDHCKIIDFSGNYKRYGPAESFKLVDRGMWEIQSDTEKNWHGKDLSNF